MFGRKKTNATAAVVKSPYYYVDREETISFDDLCGTGGVPVMFTIATFAIVFFAAQYYYQQKLNILAKDAVAGKKKEPEEKDIEDEKKRIILIKSLTNGGDLEETFIAPFVPSNMETLAGTIFFIWFIVTASFGVSRVYQGKWLNENSMEQYPFNILSFLVGCPGLDPYDVAYTKSWEEDPPTEDDEDPFDSYLGKLFSTWGIIGMVTLIAVLLPMVKTITRRTFLFLASLSILVFSIYEMYFAGSTKTAGLLAFEFFFSHHISFGLAWLILGFYQIYRARHGWVYTTSIPPETNPEEATADLNAARHAGHRLFGRTVAVPALVMHLMMALVMASRNPANQLAPMRENYFIVVFVSVNFAIWGVSWAVQAREAQAEIDGKQAEMEDKGVSDQRKQKLESEIKEASKYRDFCRNKHMYMMFQTWANSLAGSGSVRLAIWFLWTISKFFEPELRKGIDRGYCIDSAYAEGLTQDIGDSSTCVGPVFLNILLMGLIIELVKWMFLRTDTVQDARAKFSKDHNEPDFDVFADDKEGSRSSMKACLFGTLGFIICLFVLKLKPDKISLYIRLYNGSVEFQILRAYVATYKAVWGLKDQGEKEPTTARAERKFVEALGYIYGIEINQKPLILKADVGALYDDEALVKKED